MPKKGKKGKDKKAARAAAVAEERAKKQRCHDASFTAEGKPRDVLAEFAPVFANFDRNGLDLTIECHGAPTTPPELVHYMLDLTRRNMQARYEEAGWGWSDRKKRGEFEAETARFLVARRKEDGSPVAFTHFRFEIEADYEVLYVHECQVEEAAARKGLGRHLMVTMELLARKAAMKFIMLTVFKANAAAMSFYMEKLRYEVDETSPSFSYVDDAEPYEILSKCLDPELAARLKAEADEDAAALTGKPVAGAGSAAASPEAKTEGKVPAS